MFSGLNKTLVLWTMIANIITCEKGQRKEYTNYLEPKSEGRKEIRDWLTILFNDKGTYHQMNKYAIYAYTHGPVTGSGFLSVV